MLAKNSMPKILKHGNIQKYKNKIFLYKYSLNLYFSDHDV